MAALANDLNVALILNKNGLYIKGNIYATNGVFNGEVYASAFSAEGNEGKFYVDSSKFGFYDSSN